MLTGCRKKRGSSLAWRRRRTRATCETRGEREETGWKSAALYYIIIPPDVHAPSGSGLTSAPDGGAELSGPLSDVALVDEPGTGASRCAVEPGLISSWIFRHSAPPSERTSDEHH